MKSILFPGLGILLTVMVLISCKPGDHGVSPVIHTTTDNVTVSTFAGDGRYGLAEGKTEFSSFYEPYDVAADGHGNVYVADWRNARIRKVSAGIVSTLAGNDTQGYSDGNGSN